ncbi:helix-turn-helix domain-containing protein [Embleya scabrispora]|uniref:helix-turn-helix domain-containing protein n=1 Tax=Embleya scabrispora TaxID=159449 RepID=UPI00099ECC8C|nr:helix-turn-helix transcriptional regulator [Embleya scabrispora]
MAADLRRSSGGRLSGMALSSPRHVKLGQELRRLRVAAKLSMVDVHSEVDMSVATFSRLELGKKKDIDEQTVWVLLRRYGASDDDTRAVLALWETCRQEVEQWWDAYGDTVSSAYAEFIRAEHTAIECQTFTPLGLPGLTQTERYARALTAQTDGGGEERTAIFTEVRLLRQKRLYADPPLRMTAFITEAALRIDVGGERVMREQLQHLLILAELPNVHLVVIPFGSAAVAILGSGFTKFDYPDEEPSVIINAGAAGPFPATDEPSYIQRGQRLIDRLMGAGLAPGESVAMIRQYVTKWSDREF